MGRGRTGVRWCAHARQLQRRAGHGHTALTLHIRCGAQTCPSTRTAAERDSTLQDPSRVPEHSLIAWHDATGSVRGTQPGDGNLAAQLVAPALFTGGASSASPGVALLAALPVGPVSLMAGGGEAAVAGAAGGSQGVSRLAPLSGLQSGPLQSRLAGHTAETPGEQLLLRCGRPWVPQGTTAPASALTRCCAKLCASSAPCRKPSRPGICPRASPPYLPPTPHPAPRIPHPPPPAARSHVAELSFVLLSCLPGFWAVAASPRLADAPDLPPAVRARTKASLRGVAATAQRLVGRGVSTAWARGCMDCACADLRASGSCRCSRQAVGPALALTCPPATLSATYSTAPVQNAPPPSSRRAPPPPRWRRVRGRCSGWRAPSQRSARCAPQRRRSCRCALHVALSRRGSPSRPQPRAHRPGTMPVRLMHAMPGPPPTARPTPAIVNPAPGAAGG